MHLPALSLLALLPFTTALTPSYGNVTSTFEAYTHAGYHPPFSIPGLGDYLNFSGFASADLSTTSPAGYQQGCTALCAASFPFVIQYNTSAFASATLTTGPVPYGATGPVFDLYEFALGCEFFGPNGTDAAGATTYGLVPRACTVIAIGYVQGGGQEVAEWAYEPQLNADGTANMTTVLAPATFRDLEIVYWNGTWAYTEEFPSAPLVSLDSIVHGQVGDYPA